MTKSIENGSVYSHSITVGGSEIKAYVGSVNIIKIEPNKLKYSFGEIVTVQCTALKFDEELQEYKHDYDFNGNVQSKVSDVVIETVFVNGICNFDFSTSETGNFMIDVNGFTTFMEVI
jgi:hypothetical protein